MYVQIPLPHNPGRPDEVVLRMDSGRIKPHILFFAGYWQARMEDGWAVAAPDLRGLIPYLTARAGKR